MVGYCDDVVIPVSVTKYGQEAADYIIRVKAGWMPGWKHGDGKTIEQIVTVVQNWCDLSSASDSLYQIVYDDSWEHPNKPYKPDMDAYGGGSW